MSGNRIVIGILVLGAVLLGGINCSSWQNDLDTLYQPPLKMKEKEPVKAPASPARFQEMTEETPSTAESVISLTKKHAALNEEATSLRDRNRVLDDENQKLKLRLQALEADLQQTQAELTQANSLLMDILGELDAWKRDVLGFRSEMRHAAKAELEALLKILKILGAEVQDLQTTSAVAVTEPAGTK